MVRWPTGWRADRRIGQPAPALPPGPRPPCTSLLAPCRPLTSCNLSIIMIIRIIIMIIIIIICPDP